MDKCVPPPYRPTGSRAFYMALGHSPESWSNPLLVNHVIGGIAWAAQAELAHPSHAVHDTRARFLCEKHERERIGRLLVDDDGAAALDSSFQKDSLYSFQQGEQVRASATEDADNFSLLVFPCLSCSDLKRRFVATAGWLRACRAMINALQAESFCWMLLQWSCEGWS
jgi:hypothetical protein